jgi:multiple sugar transport system substrate-binding protein
VGLIVLCLIPAPTLQKYPERTPVRFWHMWTSEWKGVVDRIVDEFNESQDRYEVIPLSVPIDGADPKFLLSVTGGDPPDVMCQWNQVIPKWADAGLILPLNELMTEEDWQSVQRNAYPVALRIGMYGDNLYGLTVGLDVYACYGRVADLREAGLDPERPPQTLDELIRWGDQLNQFTPDRKLARVGFLPRGFYIYAPVFGGGFFDWNTHEVLVNTPANLRALTFLQESRAKLGIANVLRYESGHAIGDGGVTWPFISGFYSITVDGQWRVEQIAKYAPELEFVTFPVPPPDGGRKLAGWANGNFMVIPKGAKEVQGAWEFIKFWSGIEHPERAAEFYTWGGWLPMGPAIAEAPKYKEFVVKHPQYQTFLDLLPSENLQPTAPVPYQSYLWDRMWQCEDAVLRGILPATAALDRLENEIARELSTRKRFGYDDKGSALSSTRTGKSRSPS